MIILYNNYVYNSIITSSTENPDYTFDIGLKDTRLSRVSRGITFVVDVVFDLLETKIVNNFLLYSYNLTSTAIITLEANDTDVWTSPSFTSTLSFKDFYSHSSFSNQSYRYWKVTIDDVANTDEYVEISNIFLGDYLQLPDLNTGVVVPYNTNSTISKSTSGQLYGNRQLDYKAAKVVMNDIENSDRILINNFWKDVSIVAPFWIIIWEESLTTEPPIYSSLTKPLEWLKSAQQGNIWTLGLDFEECF